MEKNVKKNLRRVFFMVAIVTIFMCNFPSRLTYADTFNNLEEKLTEQEEDLSNNIDDITNNDEHDETFDDAISSITAPTEGKSRIPVIVSQIQSALKDIAVKARTMAILIYGLLVLLILIYMATVGSKSLTNRRKGFMWLFGFTIVFLVYINIPLLILYFQADKTGIPHVTIYERIIGVINFLKSNSIIISSLMAYSGIIKLIMSKNDLPNRLQGRYLIKFSIVLFIMLNIIPMAINFLI